MKKKVGIIKRVLCLSLIFLISINSFAAVVSDNDGSAFITKAEFDSLKNSFQSQIDGYNTSIDSKIDGAIASYLAGIRTVTKPTCEFVLCEEDRKAIIKSQLVSDYWAQCYKPTGNKIWNGFIAKIAGDLWSNETIFKTYELRMSKGARSWELYRQRPSGAPSANFFWPSYISAHTNLDFIGTYNTARDGWDVNMLGNSSYSFENMNTNIAQDGYGGVPIIVDSPVRSGWSAIETSGVWSPTGSRVLPWTLWCTEPLKNKFPLDIKYVAAGTSPAPTYTFTLDKMTDKFKAHAFEQKPSEFVDGIQSYDDSGTQFKNIPEYLWYRPFAYRDAINWTDGYIKFSAKLNSWKGKDYYFTSFVNIGDYGEIPVPDPSASNFKKVYYTKSNLPSGWFTLYDSYADNKRSEGSIGFAIDNKRNGSLAAPVDVWQDLYLLQSFDLKVDLFSKSDLVAPIQTIEFWHDGVFYPNGYTAP